MDAAINHFAEELLERLDKPEDYDPVETIALIEYRMRYAGPFSLLRRIAESLNRWAPFSSCAKGWNCQVTSSGSDCE